MQRLANTPLPLSIFTGIFLLVFIILATTVFQSNQLLKQAQQAVADNHPDAAQLLAEAAGTFPARPDLWQEAGQQAFLNQDYQAALTYFSRAQIAGELGTDGWVTFGSVYQVTGDHQLAIQTWQQAVEDNPSNAEALHLLATSYRQQSDYESAAAALKQLVLLQPGEPAIRYELGLLLAATDPEEAIANLVQAADLDENYQTSSDLLRRALRDALASENPAYAAILTGQALAGVDEWRLAAESFIRAIEYDINYAEAWAYVGEAKQRLGQGGLEELETALLLNPDSLAANIFSGLYWQRNNQPEQALVYFNKADDLNPNNPSLKIDLARATAEAGDLPTALAYYQQAIDLAPQTSRYWVALAEFTVDFEVFIEEEGSPAARRALELAPEDPAVLVANGRVAYLLEDQINAIRYYEDAILFDPQYAPAYLHLGLLYITQGNQSEAESALLQAVEIDLESLVGQQAQRLLEQYFP